MSRMRCGPDLSRISDAVAESVGARQVFGEPVERDGVVVIPAARVWSAGGGGGGGGVETDTVGWSEVETGDEEAVPDREGGGGGAGFGRRAAPSGAFVVNGTDVRWVPAVDVTRIVLGGQAALVAVVVVVCWAVRRRRRR
ncbi:spore germination protein GerW family protein [Antribacter gilvus]|uniref:spore germination protein GerW family protein n=1 Tax=Antribacter gilvus TaxID=2304675 RepID=UPI001981314C|nr:spore germination protein GerW family protein [Antribacter gilvus]